MWVKIHTGPLLGLDQAFAAELTLEIVPEGGRRIRVGVHQQLTQTGQFLLDPARFVQKRAGDLQVQVVLWFWFVPAAVVGFGHV